MTPSLREPRRVPVRLCSRRVLALSLVLAALTAGCVRAGGPGVTVEALDAELVFGVKETGEHAPAPPEAPVEVPEDFVPIGFPFKPFDIPLFAQPTDPCPTEFKTANPRRDAEVTVNGDLPEGGYRFRGTLIRKLNTGAVASALPDEIRVVDNYVRVKNGAGAGIDLITYDVTQPFGVRFLKTTYQVKARVRNETGDVRPGTENIYEQTPRFRSDPEAGVALKRTQLVDASGNPVAGAQNFNPQNGLLLLPLPVESSDFVSTAVDSSSGRTMVNQAGVKARERISACGEPVDGWFVDAFLAVSERTNPGAQGADNQIHWDVVIAPQYAGLIIGEAMERRYSDKPHETIVRTLMSLDPVPTS